MAADYEKLGLFYLGKRYDLAAQRPARGPDPLRLARSAHPCRRSRYDGQWQDRSWHHAPRRGGDRWRACAGDRSQRRPDESAPDVPESRALRFRAVGRCSGGLPPADDRGDATAAELAKRWKTGLAEWDQDGSRIARLREAADVRVYTPGSRAGTPLAILGQIGHDAARVGGRCPGQDRRNGRRSARTGRNERRAATQP